MTAMSQSDGISAPLAGLRVVDSSIGWASAIGQMLAEFGADVLRTTQVDDHGPKVAGRAIGAMLNARGTRKTYGAEPLPLAETDMLIVSPGTLDLPQIRADHPALVILHASDFGMTGSMARWQATDPVLHALSGELSRSGQPGREPLLPPGTLAYSCAISQAVFVLLIAHAERLRTGQGDLLDFAALDAATQALDPGYGIGGTATLGVPASQLPRGRPAGGHQYPILPCADGKVRIAVLAPRQWQGLFEWMGRPSEFSDPSFNKTGTRFASKTLLPAIIAFFADKTRAELELEGARRGVPITAVRTLTEVVESDQVLDRGVFEEMEITPGVTAPVPRSVVEIDSARITVTATAPTASPVAIAPKDAGRPLEGLRILDLGVIVVGAESGRLFADQGADVIKVESTSFPDGSRAANSGRGMSVTFATGHRNKRSLAINLRDPRGKALFLELAAKSDVILSNFKAGTLESLGLDYATVAAVNPGVVMVDSSAYGPTGPWSRRLGYGPLVRASAGLTDQWRYADDPDSYSDSITVYPDHVAGRIGAIAALALLLRRSHGGRGGTASIAQSEVMLSHMASEIAIAALEDRGVEVDPGALRGPWGVFPCAGEDAWCVVTARNDADRSALAPVLGDPALATAEVGVVEDALRVWLARHTPEAAMTELQQAGVPAAAMLRVSELPDFPYFQERSLFRTEHHPRLDDPVTAENAPVRSNRLLDPPARPAPALGEHTIEIASTILGLDGDAIATLVAEGVLEPPATSPN
ncbi:MAG: CoA transferase [Sphingobium sp.]